MKGQWGKLVGYFLATMAVASVITFAVPMIGGGGWLPDLISTEGRRIDDLFWVLMVACVVIFALVGAFIVYSMIHFRAGPGDLSDGAHIHGSARMEMAWIVIPSIIVFVLGVVSYSVLQENEIGLFDEAAAKDAGAATMQVDVHGFQFGWAFRYRDMEDEPIGNADADPSSELILPVDEVVRFNVLSCSGNEKVGRIREQVSRELSDEGESEFAEIVPGICEKEWDNTTGEDEDLAAEQATQLHEIREKQADGRELSTDEQAVLDQEPKFRGDRQFIDVNHSFWVPEARLKIDAVAGLRTYVQWKPQRVTGPDDRFQVVCAELCGSGHNAMRTDMCVVDADTFEWWSELATDERGDATCRNLRLFSCVDDIGDRDELLSSLATLTTENPEATCAEAEEAAA